MIYERILSENHTTMFSLLSRMMSFNIGHNNYNHLFKVRSERGIEYAKNTNSTLKFVSVVITVRLLSVIETSNM